MMLLSLPARALALDQRLVLFEQRFLFLNERNFIEARVTVSLNKSLSKGF